MTKLLKGNPVREKIESEIAESVKRLSEDGRKARIVTVRAGDDSGEKYYERAVLKRSEKYGIDSEAVVLPADVSQEELLKKMSELEKDSAIDGILPLMPFPDGISDDAVTASIPPEKDIDAVTGYSYASLLSNSRDDYFKACTAESCMEILNYYGYDLKGKKVTIVGRSLRVGKPLMLLMLNANATVTVCHTRTREADRLGACRNADIVVLATGQIQSFDRSFFRDGQVIIDVGTGTGRDGKMAGDLDADDIENAGIDAAYTPVPGGVGAVTTALLMRHVVTAAERNIAKAGGKD